MDIYNSINTIFEDLDLYYLSRDQVEQVVNERLAELKEKFGIETSLGPNYSSVHEFVDIGSDSVDFDHFEGNDHFDYVTARSCRSECFLSGQFSLHGIHVGPLVLYYPDGKLAAFEFYRYDSNYVNNSILDSGLSVWFDQQGNRVGRENFDIIYQSVLKEKGLGSFAFVPRISDHKFLVNDLYAKFTVGGDRFDVYDIRELLCLRSESYLSKLEADLKELYRKDQRGMSPESFQNCIDLYVYGKIDKEKFSIYCLDEIAHFMKKVDRSAVYSSPENFSGEYQSVYGKFDYHLDGEGHQCEISDSYVYIERFAAGCKREVCFLTDTSADTFYIGPRVWFYPNGDFASFEYFSPEGIYGSDITQRFYFDINGRLTSSDEMEKQFSSEWKKSMESHKAKKEQEIKKVSLERIKTYKRLSSLSKVLPKRTRRI